MSELRKVKCPDCGRTANFADEYGPAFARRICGCDPITDRHPDEMDSTRAVRQQRERRMEKLQSYLDMPASSSLAETMQFLANGWADRTYGLAYLNALRWLLRGCDKEKKANE